MSCYMVFSCASQLFMASVVNSHLIRAFSLFSLEKADGFGHSHELILHAFIRIFSQAAMPLAASCAIIYLCVVRDYSGWKFFLSTIIHLQLNQAWIAIIIFVACLAPDYCHLITPLVSAVSGFAGGFLVPKPQMPLLYSWLFYINPTHWAYQGMGKILLSDVVFPCEVRSTIECQDSTGVAILEAFGIEKANPYQSMFLLLVFLVVFLLTATIVLEVRHCNVRKTLKNLRKVSIRDQYTKVTRFVI